MCEYKSKRGARSRRGRFYSTTCMPYVRHTCFASVSLHRTLFSRTRTREVGRLPPAPSASSLAHLSCGSGARHCLWVVSSGHNYNLPTLSRSLHTGWLAWRHAAQRQKKSELILKKENNLMLFYDSYNSAEGWTR